MAKKSKKKSAAKKTRAQAGAFNVGQRVRVVEQGSYARGEVGVVQLVEGDTVFIRRECKAADEAFPASHLRAE